MKEIKLSYLKASQVCKETTYTQDQIKAPVAAELQSVFRTQLEKVDKQDKAKDQ